MSELKLLPCPFCGSDPDLLMDADNCPFVECPTCHAEIPRHIAGFEHMAIAAWNRRAAPADVGEDGLQDESTVYLATTRSGSTCYFGFASWARGWAGEDGTVQEVKLPVRDLRVVGEDGLPTLPDADEYSATRMLPNGELAPRYKAATMRQYARDAIEPHMKRCDEMRDALCKAKEEIADLRAQLAARGREREMAPEMKAALEEAHRTGATAALLPNGSAVFINYGHDYGDNAHLECTACGGSGHIEDQQARATPQPAALQEKP